MKQAGFILLLCSWASLSFGADFCVTNSAELQAALDSAGSNGQDDTIRLAQGIYSPPSGGFAFSPAASEDGFDLILSGGFVFSGAPFNLCNEPLIKDPEATVLNGGGNERPMKVRLPQAGDVAIRNLSFVDGLADASFNAGGGLAVFQDEGQTYAGVLTIENNIFLLNSAPAGGGLYVGSLSGTQSINVRILNNLFVANQATSAGGGAGTVAVDSPQPRGGTLPSPLPAVTLAHNTVVDNSSVSTVGGFVLLGSVANLYVASNNLWGNSGFDLNWFVDSTRRLLWNNNIEDSNFNLDPPSSASGNISVEPQYVSCGPLCVDRVPALGSPLIDAGFQPIGPAFQPWLLPANDLDGGPRVLGQAVDIGAYEGADERIFADRFQTP